jgi:hypothetical protein
MDECALCMEMNILEISAKKRHWPNNVRLEILGPPKQELETHVKQSYQDCSFSSS